MFSILIESIYRNISNTQHLACANGSICSNTANGDLCRQNTACQSSGNCMNDRANTNVYSNSAPSCANGSPDTTTICQRDRTFTFPNHWIEALRRMDLFGAQLL